MLPTTGPACSSVGVGDSLVACRQTVITEFEFLYQYFTSLYSQLLEC